MPNVLLNQLGRAVTHAPAMVFAVSDRIAPLRLPGLEARDFARVFPELSDDAAREADRWSRCQLMRNQLISEAIRLYSYDKRIAAIAIAQPLLAAVTPPAIIITFHTGALTMLGFALEQLPAEVLIVRSAAGGGPPHASFERAVTGSEEQQRALLFRRCVDFLRSGRFVFMAADPLRVSPETLRVPFRRGSIRLARGPFSLSRITGTPIIPLVARWCGPSVEFVLGEPVQPSGDEAGNAAAVAAWLDRYLSAAPREISRHTLMLMT